LVVIQDRIEGFSSIARYDKRSLKIVLPPGEPNEKNDIAWAKVCALRAPF